LKRKQLLVVGTVAALGMVSAAGASLVSAATVLSDDNTSSLVEKLADKFNLKKDDVQKVFDQDKADKQAQREKQVSDYLQKKVDEGNITLAQKTLVENKLKELKTARENERKDLTTWAKSNSIDARYVIPMGRGASDTRLQKLVESGKITSAQKTLIENKQKELKTAHESQRNDLEKWASDNNINIDDIMPFGGERGIGRGPGPKDSIPN
jgi:DNA-dependent RNA polymerase auxiliary subunit epsilon